MKNTVQLLIITLSLTNLCSSSKTNLSAFGDVYKSRRFSYRENFTKNCDNESYLCLRKCCKEEYALLNNYCIRDNSSSLNMSSIAFEPHSLKESKIQFVVGMPKCEFYSLDPENRQDDEHHVDRDGNLILTNLQLNYNHSQFCFDYSLPERQIIGYACFAEEPIQKTINKYLVVAGFLISMPFLLATFVVYACLREKNLHAKCLMCFVITFFGATFLIVYMKLFTPPSVPGICKFMGLFTYFLFMVSYFWLNAMSIDIWWTFSGLRGFTKNKSESERKRFLLYSLYAWGGPLVLVLVVATLIFIPGIPPTKWYHPDIGNGHCWFGHEYATLIYFYGPIAILILANIIFFSITIWKIKKIQQDTSVLNNDESQKHNFENNKQRFNLYIKLMLAMGVNWSMEIISWIIAWKIIEVPIAIWYLTDFCNAMYGVIIFFIFVFKKNMLKTIKERFSSTLSLIRTSS